MNNPFFKNQMIEIENENEKSKKRIRELEIKIRACERMISDFVELLENDGLDMTNLRTLAKELGLELNHEIH